MRPPVVLVGIALACSAPKPSSPTSRTPNVGYAGYGLVGCAVGDPVSACAKLFGTPKLTKGYATFPDKGIQLSIDEANNVVAVFVMYRWKDGAPFAGAIERGIGASSSIGDVLDRFGTPKDTSDSVVSEFGEYPGAKDHSLFYDGALFTFYDGALAHVALNSKSR